MATRALAILLTTCLLFSCHLVVLSPQALARDLAPEVGPVLSQMAPDVAPVRPAPESPESNAAPNETQPAHNVAGAVTNDPPGPADSGQATPADRARDGGGKATTAYLTYKTPYEFFLTTLTIALAVALALILSVMAWRKAITEVFVRSFMVVVIVFAALFLVVAGYSDEQTAPVFGLLGTIAGYIFGRSQARDENDENRPPNPPPQAP